jgi:hypothetical protein
VRFSWVDRLCIVQDDDKEKAYQSSAMGDIHSAASFVIIAAYGDGMYYGLPGFSRSRTVTQQQSDEFCAIVLTQVAENGKDGRHQPLAKWGTRGWTYQEAALARKSLYFTNRRVYYECEQLLSHEDEYKNDHAVEKRWTSKTARSSLRTTAISTITAVEHFPIVPTCTPLSPTSQTRFLALISRPFMAYRYLISVLHCNG